MGQGAQALCCARQADDSHAYAPRLLPLCTRNRAVCASSSTVTWRQAAPGHLQQWVLGRVTSAWAPRQQQPRCNEWVRTATSVCPAAPSNASRLITVLATVMQAFHWSLWLACGGTAVVVRGRHKMHHPGAILVPYSRSCRTDALRSLPAAHGTLRRMRCCCRRVQCWQLLQC